MVKGPLSWLTSDVIFLSLKKQWTMDETLHHGGWLNPHPTQASDDYIVLDQLDHLFPFVLCLFLRVFVKQGAGKDWKFEIIRCKLLCLEWINNKVWLYSSGNCIQYPTINHTEKEYEKGMHITESLCSITEIGVALQIDYTSIKWKEERQKEKGRGEKRKKENSCWKQAKLSERLKGSCRVSSECSMGKGHCALPISEDVSNFFHENSLPLNERFFIAVPLRC